MAAGSKMSMTLLIDSATNRVLFAEAGKDVADFIFHIMGLPIGTVIRLLKKQEIGGSLGNIYDSIENLKETYIQPNQTKDKLLKPTSPIDPTFSNPLILSLESDDEELVPEKTKKKSAAVMVGYKCNNHFYFCDDPRGICPNCRTTMSAKMTYVAPPPLPEPNHVKNDGELSGFVKGVVTYMVMDDLVVKPMSTISSIALLNKLNVKDVGALEEKEVELGIDEALNLLKASLSSKAVLTTVFLGKGVDKRQDVPAVPAGV
ncbi:OLC1v1034233C1 [Oldenlandia corymbosa var. corymbosa]|uniref:OLC1v1034233C1 n=1 Tax=Oldenlandia corymbosa var. corymbosa TaxID=529605 RepID=A0AAV1CQA6_OLDCO|nr:OLC1v1034233C1 [Oldenlandia corymbosa var. corymbosa]